MNSMETKPCSVCGKPTTGRIGENRPICLFCYVGPERIAFWKELRLAGKDSEPDGTLIPLCDAELFNGGKIPPVLPGWKVRWSESPLPVPCEGDFILIKWDDHPDDERATFELLDAKTDSEKKVRWFGLISGIGFNLQRSGFKDEHIQAWAWIKKGS